MFWSNLYWFVSGTLIFGLSLANFVRPTVRAETASWSNRHVKLRPPDHEKGKMEFWALMTVITFVVWLVLAYRLAVYW